MENTKISEKEERIKRLEYLKNLNINPYPSDCIKTHEIKQALQIFDDLEKTKKEIYLCGRLRTIRTHGNLTFANLQDEDENIQIAISKKDIGVEEYKKFINSIDIGDFIETKGYFFTTHKGEKSLMVLAWKILTKTLRPLPDKWYGLQDEEERFRKRYLDIIFNPEIKEIIQKKAIFWSSIREYLSKNKFLEVETPILETTTGGADARPFITHHNALNIDVFLRISMGELWQKRLMVAGFNKTFEIGRQFRNEGMDAEHLQDYTQMEFYWAYADFNNVMKLVEDLYKHVAEKTFGKLLFKIGNFNVDFSQKWDRIDYRETILKFTNIDISDTNLEKIEKKLNESNIIYEKKGFNIARAIDNLWKYCRRQIGGPCFVINIPIEVSPLAKKLPNNPNFTMRFHPIIAGSELGNGYSELNDPIEQAARFRQQSELRKLGDEEAQMDDEDFVEALEYGMPPTCGFGMSERVFSFLINKPMRECQIFPLMRPKNLIDKKKFLKIL